MPPSLTHTKAFQHDFGSSSKQKHNASSSARLPDHGTLKLATARRDRPSTYGPRTLCSLTLSACRLLRRGRRAGNKEASFVTFALKCSRTYWPSTVHEVWKPTSQKATIRMSLTIPPPPASSVHVEIFKQWQKQLLPWLRCRWRYLQLAVHPYIIDNRLSGTGSQWARSLWRETPYTPYITCFGLWWELGVETQKNSEHANAADASWWEIKPILLGKRPKSFLLSKLLP